MNVNSQNARLAVKVPKAAKLLDISVPQAYVLIRRRELPAIRVGGNYRVPLAALEELTERTLSDADES